MVHNPKSAARRIERQMISADVEFHYQFCLQFIDHKKTTCLLGFGMFPFWSLFVIETHKYLVSHFPKFADRFVLKHDRIIQASRSRVKLFQSTGKRIHDHTEHLEGLTTFASQQTNYGHKGLLTPLRKLIQRDFFVWLYDNHVFCTMLSALFNLGIDPATLPAALPGKFRSLSEISFEVPKQFACYVCDLRNCFHDLPRNATHILCNYNLDDAGFESVDKMAQRHLTHVFNSKATKTLNSMFYLALTSINYVEYVFRNIALDNSDTSFKLKFLTLYHVFHNLKLLQNFFRPRGDLSPTSIHHLAQILGNSELRNLVANSKSNFRNILVHYKIPPSPPIQLQPNVRYFGLIEHFYDGHTFDDVSSMVDRQLSRTAQELELWLNTARL